MQFQNGINTHRDNSNKYYANLINNSVDEKLQPNKESIYHMYNKNILKINDEKNNGNYTSREKEFSNYENFSSMIKEEIKSKIKNYLKCR